MLRVGGFYLCVCRSSISLPYISYDELDPVELLLILFSFLLPFSFSLNGRLR